MILNPFWCLVREMEKVIIYTAKRFDFKNSFVHVPKDIGNDKYLKIVNHKYIDNLRDSNLQKEFIELLKELDIEVEII